MTQTGEKTHIPREPMSRDPQPPPPPKEDEVTHVKIRVSLFFDGTGNNRVNTRERLANSEIYKKYGKDDNSYANDESNVSRLHDCIKEGSEGYNHHVALYVDGVGTRERDSDVLFGMGFGRWGRGTGVAEKVDKGVRMAVSAVMKVLPRRKEVHIDRLTLDTCGFSRGAAAARYCLYRAFNDEKGGWFGSDWYGLPTALERQGVPVGYFDIHAVALFDTVSSYGINHNDDVEELKLDAISAAASVFHLAAGNEYRVNFALTNIDSAGGKGQEVFLPGAHSDIGGGYVDDDTENKDIKEGDATPDIAKFLVHGGWYAPKEAIYTALEHEESEGKTRKVGRKAWLRRQGISNNYSFIPLRLMADFVVKEGLQLNDKLKGSFKPPPALEGLHNQLKAKVASREPSDIGEWAANDESARALRRRYLHVSFSNNTGMRPRIIQSGDRFVPEREIIRG